MQSRTEYPAAIRRWKPHDYPLHLLLNRESAEWSYSNMTDSQIAAIRAEFPLIAKQDRVYFDNAATSQKPACVLQAAQEFYESYNANVLRGLYPLSVEATERYEAARTTVQQFIHAAAPEEIIFTRNTTESINLVAYSYGLSHLKAGDEIVVSILEHHSNLLPWQMVARMTGAKLVYLECDPDGTISKERMDAAFSDHTKLVAIGMVSNVLGCVNPVAELVKRARQCGAVILMDAAQGAPHMAVETMPIATNFVWSEKAASIRSLEIVPSGSHSR